jgi:Arc/MetJ-type ribon-helix-helix transcriptional regulator
MQAERWKQIEDVYQAALAQPAERRAAYLAQAYPDDPQLLARDRCIGGMVNGMATTKITITLPDHQLREIRKRVADQETPSVSGFIQRAVQKSLENADAFRAMVDEALQATGGALKPAERAWARRVLSPRKRGGKPRKAA